MQVEDNCTLGGLRAVIEERLAVPMADQKLSLQQGLVRARRCLLMVHLNTTAAAAAALLVAAVQGLTRRPLTICSHRTYTPLLPAAPSAPRMTLSTRPRPKSAADDKEALKEVLPSQ